VVRELLGVLNHGCSRVTAGNHLRPRPASLPQRADADGLRLTLCSRLQQLLQWWRSDGGFLVHQQHGRDLLRRRLSMCAHSRCCVPASHAPPAARSERCWLGRDTVRATNCNAVLTALLRLLPLECARIVLHCICEHIDDIMSNASMCTGVAPDYTPTTCKPVFRIGAETSFLHHFVPK